MFKLVIHEAGKEARDILLEERNYSLGRDEENDVVLSDEAASRKHANITFDDGVYTLEDLQSTAGVYVNKEKVQGQCSLKAGDHILIGSTKLSLEGDPPVIEPEMDEDSTKVLSPDILKKYLEEEAAGKDEDTAVFEMPEESEQTDDVEEDKTRVIAANAVGVADESEPMDDDDKTIIVAPETTSTPIDEDRTVIVSAQDTSSLTTAYHRLLVVSKEMLGEQFILEQTDITLGRSDECYITIDDSAISSFHARFRIEGDHCFITDMASSNGTMVNGARVGEEHQLSDGDEIKVGSVKLRFVHRDTTASSEELIAQLNRQGARKRMKMAGIGGAALLCILLLLVLLSPDGEQSDKKPAEQGAKQQEDILEPLATLPSATDSAEAPIVADKLATSSADLYFDTAQELLAYRLWDEAVEKLMEVEKIDENYSGLDDALLLARSEAFNRDLFEKGLRMIGEGDPNAGILSLEGIPENSVYYGEALLEIQFAREQLPGFDGETSLSAEMTGDGTADTGQGFVDQILKYYAQGDVQIALTKLDTALASQDVESDEALKEQLTLLKEDITQAQEFYTKGQTEYDSKKYKKAFQTWSQVVSLDQELVGERKSHFSNSIAVFMADELYRKARKDYEKGNYVAARNTCIKALTASPGHEGCTEIAEALGQIAKKLYEEGYILEDLNPSLAVKKWRKALDVCPPDNPYYEKAKSRIARYETP